MSSDKVFLASVFSMLCTNNPNLTSLNLAYKQLDAADIINLSEALKVNHTLTKLYLDSNEIDDDGIKKLSESLKVNRTLIRLYLSNNRIKADGAKALGEALEVNDVLRELNLFNNHIRATGAQYISKALKFNRSLVGLNLGSNQIDSNGARHLSDALSVNCTLIILKLFGNQIGDNGTHDIHKALERNTTLANLNLNYNHISDDSAITLLITRNMKIRRQTFIRDIILLAKTASDSNPNFLWTDLPKESRLHILSLLTFDEAYIGKTTQQIASFIKFILANSNKCYTLIKNKQKIKLIGHTDNKGNYCIRFFELKPSSNSVEQLQPTAEDQDINFSKAQQVSINFP